MTRARVKSGEHVLVTGASGGVGSAAVQLAKARGANVWAVTKSIKADSVRKLGADETISRETDLTVTPGSNSLDAVTLYLKDLSLFGCTVLEPEILKNLAASYEESPTVRNSV